MVFFLEKILINLRYQLSFWSHDIFYLANIFIVFRMDSCIAFKFLIKVHHYHVLMSVVTSVRCLEELLSSHFSSLMRWIIVTVFKWRMYSRLKQHVKLQEYINWKLPFEVVQFVLNFLILFLLHCLLFRFICQDFIFTFEYPKCRYFIQHLRIRVIL